VATAPSDIHATNPGGKVIPAVPRSNPPLGSNRKGAWRSQVWQISVGIVVAAIILVFVYWKFFAPVEVHSQEVKAGEIITEVMGTGTVEAHVKVTISTKISGRLTEVLVDQGDQVTAGQIVAHIEDLDFKHQVEVEEATVSARKATVERLIADKTFATATLEVAARNYRRADTLLEKKTISKEDHDRYLDLLTTGKAGLERAEAALVEGQKLLIAAEKTLEYQQAKLADTVIAAPFDGLIVRRDRDPGDVLVPGTSVLSLVSLKEVWVSAWVDETKMAGLKPGQPARVVFRSEPAVSYEGSVIRLGRETDRETREFLVDVQPTKLPEQWSVGQRAEVYIETARKSQVTLLPSSFLVKRNGKAGAFVWGQGRATWRPLIIGLQGRREMEVIEGLRLGEIVVMPANPKAGPLMDGQRVTLP
jgi:HlyD family secretion protein